MLNNLPTTCTAELLAASTTAHVFFWEPLELMRRTALTGWVLLFDERSRGSGAAFLRLVAAMFISLAFLVALLSVKPYNRPEDDVLATMSQLMLTASKAGSEPREVGSEPGDVGSEPGEVGSAPRDVGSEPGDVGSAPRDVGSEPGDVSETGEVGSESGKVRSEPGDVESAPRGASLATLAALLKPTPQAGLESVDE